MTFTQLVRPVTPLLDPRFRYIPAANTDVRLTWQRFGWQPSTKEALRHVA